MKHLLILILLLVVPATAETYDRVLAEVNQGIILQSDLAPRLLPFHAQLKSVSKKERERKMQKIGRQLLKELIDEELILQAAKEANVGKLSSEEIKKQLDATKAKFELDDEGLARELAAQGQTIASYKEVLKRQYARVQAVNFFVRSKVSVTDKDVEERYEAIKKRSTGQVGSVRLYQLVIGAPPGSSDETLAAAKAKADEIAKQATDVKTFQELVTLNSTDEVTKAGGGDLGWIERGTMPASWEQIVFALTPGKVSNPIKGPEGYRLFFVSEQKKDSLAPFSKMKAQIKDEIYGQRLQKAVEEWVKKLRKKAHISVKV